MRDMHMIDYHFALLEPLGLSNVSRAVRMELPKSTREAADELLSAHTIKRDFIVFHPGSARAEKFLNPQRWADVINHAADNYDVHLVLAGRSSPLEQRHTCD